MSRDPAAATHHSSLITGFREDLPRVEAALGVEGALRRAHRLEISRGEDPGHVRLLFQADAVLARKRAAQFDALLEDVRAGLDDALGFVGVALVEDDAGMEVAVASVEDVGDGQVVALADFGYGAQHLHQPGAGDDAVLAVIAGLALPQRAHRP